MKQLSISSIGIPKMPVDGAGVRFHSEKAFKGLLGTVSDTETQDMGDSVVSFAKSPWTRKTNVISR